MTIKIRQTKDYTMYKSLAGMGISFLRHTDGENSLWDIEFDEQKVAYLVGCSEDEFKDWINKEIKF
jgi:hypothetical protein